MPKRTDQDHEQTDKKRWENRFYDIPARDAYTESKDKEALDKQCL